MNVTIMKQKKRLSTIVFEHFEDALVFGRIAERELVVEVLLRANSRQERVHLVAELGEVVDHYDDTARREQPVAAVTIEHINRSSIN